MIGTRVNPDFEAVTPAPYYREWALIAGLGGHRGDEPVGSHARAADSHDWGDLVRPGVGTAPAAITARRQC